MKEVTAVKTVGAVPNRIRRAVRWALCALALLLAATALAESTAALTIVFEAENRPVANAPFRIYRVAEWDGGSFALCGDFAGYPVSLEDLDSEGWGVAANTLAGYAARDGVAPTRSGATGAEGTLTFEGLETGLYLVTGDPVFREGRVCHPQPALVALPTRGADGEWSAQVTVQIKDGEPSGGALDLTVIKVWKDGDAAARPEGITVELLGNGVRIDTVVLSKDNSWRYTWQNLDAETLWQAVEAPVPEGYTVTIDREGTLITITNTAPGTSGGNPSLPQTGLLWWPVPVLTVAGMALFLCGWYGRRKGDRKR